LPVREDDVHGLEQQPIGQLMTIVHEHGEQSVVDAETAGERLVTAEYFGGGLQQFRGSRAQGSFQESRTLETSIT
jgi:hypothetical protein